LIAVKDIGVTGGVRSSQRRGEKICALGKITMLDEWILAWDGPILLDKCMTPVFSSHQNCAFLYASFIS
jgi:hypothetical protein